MFIYNNVLGLKTSLLLQDSMLWNTYWYVPYAICAGSYANFTVLLQRKDWSGLIGHKRGRKDFVLFCGQ